MNSSKEWNDYREPDSNKYREGAGIVALDESGEIPKAYFIARGPEAPRMAEAIDIGAGVRERMDGYGETQLREGFAELIVYDEEEDIWHLPDALEEYTEIDDLEGRASELIKEDELFEKIFTDYVEASMAESPLAYNPVIKTYESGSPITPPNSEYVIKEQKGNWQTGVITEEDEGGTDSLEYVIALQLKLPENASIYDGEAFNTGDLKDEDGNWKLREERDGDWIWLNRMILGLGTDITWNWKDKKGELLQSGEIQKEGKNTDIINEVEERQGLKNGATVKSAAFGIEDLLEQ